MQERAEYIGASQDLKKLPSAANAVGRKWVEVHNKPWGLGYSVVIHRLGAQ